MAADWTTGVFTLAGAALTGVLALATARSQRWQTRTQLEASEKQRISDLRREAYAKFYAAGSQFAFYMTGLNGRLRANGIAKADATEYPVVMMGLSQAAAEARMLGPDAVSEAVDAYFQRVTGLVQRLYDGPNSTLKPLAEQELSQFLTAVSESLEEFSQTARTVLGYS